MILQISNDSNSPSSKAARFLARLAAAALLAASGLAAAAPDVHRFTLFLDLDQSSATGCSRTIGAGSLVGLEQAWTAVVQSTPAGGNVISLENERCFGGSWTAATAYSNTIWPVGLGAGDRALGAIEFYVPLAEVPATTVQAWVGSVSGLGATDGAGPFTITLPSAPPVMVPLSGGLLLILAASLVGAVFLRRARLLPVILLVAVPVGIAWAAVVLDGQVSDWVGRPAAVSRAVPPGLPNAAIGSVYWQTEAGRLYVRIDADIRARTSDNQPPTVNAGPAQTVTLPARANLAGQATDDGLPAPPRLVTRWNQVGGPAGVTFADPTALNTTASLPTAGVYVLRLSANDGAASASSDVTITALDTGPTLKAIPNASVPAGSEFGLRLAGSSPSALETLTYSLPTAPSGAALAPAPLLKWVPSLAQVGVQNFTARVTDSRGRSDTKSFQVIVTSANLPPAFGALPDETVAAGDTFTRTLTATDPNPGDTLTFSLDSGPPGMTLSGAGLIWSTAGTPPGSYGVLVRVADAGGLSDTRRFFVTVTPSSVPVAVAIDDRYDARFGQSLSVTAPNGVLANDVNPGAGALTATKATDPARGTLTAFNADGSFTYAAPAGYAGPTFDARIQLNAAQGVPFNNRSRAADVNGDGFPDVVVNNGNSNFVAVSTKDGAGLWSIGDMINPTPTATGRCSISSAQADFAIGDIDDDGFADIVTPISCEVDSDVGPGNFQAERLAAFDGRTGAVKWVSARLGDGKDKEATRFVAPTIARLAPGEKPSILIGQTRVDSTGSLSCRGVLPTAPESRCRIVTILNGEDGSIRSAGGSVPTPGRMYSTGMSSGSPLRGDGYIAGAGQPYTPWTPAMAIDLDGDGTVEIVYAGVVFNADGSVRWENPHGVLASAIANFDGGNDIEILTTERRYVPSAPAQYFIAVRKAADGRIVWQTPIPESYDMGRPTVGDLDGDGKPDVVFVINRSVYALDHLGRYRWAFVTPQGTYSGYGGGTEIRNLVTRETVPAIFDLDGDGVAEVVVQGIYPVWFLDGATGKLRDTVILTNPDVPFTYPNNYQYGTSPRPFILDTRNNGDARIAMFLENGAYACCNTTIGSGLYVLESANTPWKAAPRTMHQAAYWPGSLQDSGRVPDPAASRSAFLSPGTNTFGTPGRTGIPVDPRARETTSFTYTASAGGLTSAPATVTFDLKPPNRPPVFTSSPPTRFVYVPGQAFNYFPTVMDPDPGDTVTLSLALAQSPQEWRICTASEVSAGRCGPTQVGALTTSPNEIRSFPHSVIIAATDTQGEVTYQIVDLVPATGAANAPNVIGLSLASATTVLSDAGFALGEVTEAYASQAAGLVIAQSPTAGVATTLGEKIALTVSKGPIPVPVPAVVGKVEALASSDLAAAGFTSVVTRVFSTTVEAGIVIDQSPPAGALLSPIPANPVSLTVTAGSGLELRLSSATVTAGTAITLIPIATDASGNPTATPSLTYSVAPRASPFLGSLPTISGVQILTTASMLGSFTVTATDSVGGRTASADFAVLKPPPAGQESNGSVIGGMMRALEDMEAIGRQLKAALAANDVPLMTSLLKQYVTTWRTVDPADLKFTVPIVLPEGFAATEADMQRFGLSPTGQDMLIQQILRDGSDDLRAWTAGLQATGTSIAQLDALADNFSLRAGRINGLALSEYGGAMVNPEMIQLIAHDIPEFYEALTNELAPVVGLPRRDAVYPQLKVAHAGKSSLAELAVTAAVTKIVDKVTDQAAKMYTNARRFAIDIMGYSAFSAAVMATTRHLKEFAYGKDLVETVSGASLSIRVFGSPFSFIEIESPTRRHHLFDVTIIGPSLFTEPTLAIEDAIKKLKDGMSYGREVASNPSKVKNADDVQKLAKEFKKKADEVLKSGSTAIAATKKAAERLFQSPDGIENSCLFTFAVPCRQLRYEYGFASVYEYKPPDGLGDFTGIPVLILFIVHDRVTGDMHFGNYSFLPTPPSK